MSLWEKLSIDDRPMLLTAYSPDIVRITNDEAAFGDLVLAGNGEGVVVATGVPTNIGYDEVIAHSIAWGIVSPDDCKVFAFTDAAFADYAVRHGALLLSDFHGKIPNGTPLVNWDGGVPDMSSVTPELIDEAAPCIVAAEVARHLPPIFRNNNGHRFAEQKLAVVDRCGFGVSAAKSAGMDVSILESALSSEQDRRRIRMFSILLDAAEKRGTSDLTACLPEHARLLLSECESVLRIWRRRLDEMHLAFSISDPAGLSELASSTLPTLAGPLGIVSDANALSEGVPEEDILCSAERSRERL